MRLRCLMTALSLSAWLLLPGCGSAPAIADQTVEIDAFTPENVAENVSVGSDILFTTAYQDIQSMAQDADAIVQGVVRNIEYSDAGGHIRTKLNLLVEESFLGDVAPNTEISILEPGGYLRLKTYYDLTHRVYFPEAFTQQDVEDGKTVDLRHTHGRPEAIVGDTLLLFLAKSSSPLYDGKQVIAPTLAKADYPAGSWATLGVYMGKFLKTSSGYERAGFYATLDEGDVSIQWSFTEQEMMDQLDKAK